MKGELMLNGDPANASPSEIDTELARLVAIQLDQWPVRAAERHLR